VAGLVGSTAEILPTRLLVSAVTLLRRKKMNRSSGGRGSLFLFTRALNYGLRSGLGDQMNFRTWHSEKALNLGSW
jgi:hypothetical protein